MFMQWQPLGDPTAFTALFRSWRRAFRMSGEEKPQDQVQVYGSSTTVISAVPVYVFIHSLRRTSYLLLLLDPQGETDDSV